MSVGDRYTPTGRRIRLTAEDTELRIGTVGAVIAGLEVGGVALTEPIAEDARPAYCNGIHLAPWPNRVRDGLWEHDGRAQQLDITEPERRNALHGLVQFAEFEIRHSDDRSAILGAYIPPQHGWPFSLDVEVEYRAEPEGLSATHRARNLSAVPAPYATGAHPYLRIGAHDVADLRITVPAEQYLDVDDRLNPLGVEQVAGTRFDLRESRVIRELDLDTAYAALTPVDGAVAWLDAPDGARLSLIQDADWRFTQVFTTTIWPDAAAAGGLRTAVAVEPMTALPDALNTGEGIAWLEPGELWEGSWALRYERSPR
ncbi:MAG: aldose 1-epimerase family protein [Micrococcales bacterium]|nr:aldose 1-epimerase family protein [Micrococcales bacterium]